MPLFVFEFLGTTELIAIMLVALVLFGPRRLPELGRTIGKTLGEFKRSTEDFKRTWEREVELDKLEHEMRIDYVSAGGDSSIAAAPPGEFAAVDAQPAVAEAGADSTTTTPFFQDPVPAQQTIARGSATAVASADNDTSISTPPMDEAQEDTADSSTRVH